MRIIKVIEVGVNISDPIELYVNPDKLRQLLADKYEGRCYAGCYVEKVTRILAHSDCVINQDGPPTFGTLSVQIEVSALIYLSGEIINGCTINSVEESCIVCAADHAAIIIERGDNPYLSPFKPGQIISVRAADARYPISNSAISVGAVIYVPTTEFIAYKVPATYFAFTEIETGMLDDVLGRIEAEEQYKKDGAHAKEYGVFDQYLYPYKQKQALPRGVTAELTITGLVTAIRADGGAKLLKSRACLSRDPGMGLSEPTVYAYDSETAAGVEVAEMDAMSVILTILEDYCAHLRTLREMVGVYHSPEIIKANHSLWMLYKKVKK
jgi:hypothetical protein